MIVSHSLRFVYIGPPKTGSTSMHVWLRQPTLFDARRDIDTSKTGGQHDWIVPQDAAGYYVFATTRDYDSWLNSLWRQSRNDSIDYPGEPLMDYGTFLAWRHGCGNPFYSRELSDYYPPVVDYMLQCEHLAADIMNLPFFSVFCGRLKSFPHENCNKRTPTNKATKYEMVSRGTEDPVIWPAAEPVSVWRQPRHAARTRRRPAR